LEVARWSSGTTRIQPHHRTEHPLDEIPSVPAALHGHEHHDTYRSRSRTDAISAAPIALRRSPATSFASTRCTRNGLAELDSQMEPSESASVGGEPTLYRRVRELCQHAARETQLSVYVHDAWPPHRLSDGRSNSEVAVHFIRVSMDGVGADTYESIRRRSFSELQARLKLVRAISCFRCQYRRQRAHLARSRAMSPRLLRMLEPSELLAPPAGARAQRVEESPTQRCTTLRRWVDAYSGPLKLCINESARRRLPDLRSLGRGAWSSCLRAHRRSGRHQVFFISWMTGVPLGGGGVLERTRPTRPRPCGEETHEDLVSARLRTLREPRDDRALRRCYRGDKGKGDHRCD
jgi:hypothetical protein